MLQSVVEIRFTYHFHPYLRIYFKNFKRRCQIDEIFIANFKSYGVISHFLQPLAPSNHFHAEPK